MQKSELYIPKEESLEKLEEGVIEKARKRSEERKKAREDNK